MSEEMKNGNVSLAMEAQEPIVTEVDNDVALDVDVPNDIEITLDQPEVISQELSGDSAVGMIAGSLNSLAKEETLTQGISSVESKVEEESLAIQGKIDGLSTTFDDIYAQQLASIIG